jgi:hypothetical protein
MNMKDFVSGAATGVVGDYILFNVVQALSSVTPEWGTYGWGLFAAFNVAVAFWLKHALTGSNGD